MASKESESARTRLLRYHRSVWDFLAELPRGQKRFWVCVLATGGAAGLGAALLMELLSLVQELAWPPSASFLESANAATGTRRLVVLTAGGLLVAAVTILARRPISGHGTAGILEAIWLRAGQYSLGRALVRGVSAITVVGLGAPLGREGALISTGAGVGSSLARRLALTDDQARVLVACGAASGIAAAYNTPLGGALFGLEVLLGSFALELLGPIVVSCVTATVVSRLLLHSEQAYQIPEYVLIGGRDVVALLAVAPLLGLASALIVRVIDRSSVALDGRPRWLTIVAPVAAMAATGAVSVWVPQVLGNGYDAVNHALLGELPISLLLVLPAAKLAVTALCSASGVPGGLFTPTLFFGAMLGGAAGWGLQAVWPETAGPGAYALIGMAGVLAGTTHTAVSAVLILFEMTRDYALVPPLMATAVVAAGVSRAVEPLSLYTGVLRRRNIAIPEIPKPDWLGSRSTAPAPVRSEVAVVAPGARFTEVMGRLLALPPGSDLYVTDGEGRFLGAIVLDSLKGALPDSSFLADLVAVDLVDGLVVPLHAGTTLGEAAARLVDAPIESLPVVDPQTGRLVGVIAKRDVLKVARY